MAVTFTARSVGLMVASSLALGWLTGSMSEPSVPEQSQRGAVNRQSTEAQTVPRAERLRELLSEPPLPGRGRNPFVFGVRAPRSVRDHQEHGEEAVTPPTAIPAAPPPPLFRLSGIASNVENGAPVLTAILIDNGAMVFVKAGDKLSNGHSVVRVEEMSVTLVDAQGVTQTIRLP